MTSPRDNLITWLRDAHAMEGQAISLLETQIQRLEDYPEALPRLRQHLEETRRQQQTVEECLARLGSEPSALKEGATKFAANMQGVMHAMASDEVLKHALASHAFEQFEAGSYCSLVAAAEEAGEPEIAAGCRRLMEEEQAMADFVWQNLPGLTRHYLNRAADGGAAKR